MYIKLVKAGVSVMSTKGRKTLQIQVLVWVITHLLTVLIQTDYLM